MQPPFLLGTLYPHGRWFYFPVVFVIKSTLGFLALLLMSLLFGEWIGPDRFWKALYLVLPVAVMVLVAMQSGLNIGYRHVLPIVPFLCILIAGGVVAIWHRNRAWKAAVVLLLVFHIASSLRAYPNYLPYSNEAFGGPMKTYKVLTDSNVDWGQGLYQLRDYIKANGIRDCWLAYDGAADPAYYGIPCRKLPANIGDAGAVPPPEAEGLFFISDLTLSGIEWEPGDLNPYREFARATPVANIGGAILVYRGKFDLRDIAAVMHIARAYAALGDKPAEAAIRGAGRSRNHAGQRARSPGPGTGPGGIRTPRRGATGDRDGTAAHAGDWAAMVSTADRGSAQDIEPARKRVQPVNAKEAAVWRQPLELQNLPAIYSKRRRAKPAKPRTPLPSKSKEAGSGVVV